MTIQMLQVNLSKYKKSVKRNIIADSNLLKIMLKLEKYQRTKKWMIIIHFTSTNTKLYNETSGLQNKPEPSSLRNLILDESFDRSSKNLTPELHKS